MTWLSDEPMRPRPINATRSKCGCSSHELRQCGNDGAVGFLIADGQTQAHPASHSLPCAAGRCRGRSGRHRPRGALRAAAGKCTSRKLPTLGVTLRPSASSSRVSQASQWSLWATRAARHGRSAIAAAPAASAGADDIERPANAVERVGDMLRAIGPAEPQARQGRGSSKMSASSRHCRMARRARSRLHSHCAGHIRHRPRRARAGSPPAGRHAAA